MKKLLSVDEMYNYLLDQNVVSEEALNLISAINGYNEQTMLDVIYARTGLRSFDDLIAEID